MAAIISHRCEQFYVLQTLFKAILKHAHSFCTGLERPRSSTTTCPLESLFDELAIPQELKDTQLQHTELQTLSRKMVHYEAKLDSETSNSESNRVTQEKVKTFDSKLKQLVSSVSIHHSVNSMLSYSQSVASDG